MQVQEIHPIAAELQDKKRVKEWVPVLQKMPVVEVGEILSTLENETFIGVLSHFTPQQQGLIFGELDPVRQLEIFQQVSKKKFAPVFEQIPSDLRADFFQELSRQEQAELLPFLSSQTKEDVLKLSSYPPETAGGIMSTDYATVFAYMTCGHAIAKVRKDAPSKKTVYYVYVVDSQQRMIGFVTLKDLILAEPESGVKDILHTEFVAATILEDRESVAEKIGKYDLVVLPVLNENDQLVGIVTHDDAIDVIQAEQTEDMEKFMGIVPGRTEANYLQVSSWTHFKRRIVWVLSLAVVGIISGLIIHSYESAIESLVLLALYMPMVADTGGNCGSQAATVVIRALALGHIKTGNWLRIVWKEARVALLLAVCLGLVAFGKVLFL